MFCKIVRHISVAAALLSVWGCDITSNDVVTLKEGNTVYRDKPPMANATDWACSTWATRWRTADNGRTGCDKDRDR